MISPSVVARIVFAVLLASAVASPGVAQDRLLTIDWPGGSMDNWGRYGASLCGFVDRDGDGVRDILVGSAFLHNGLTPNVRLYSGHTGAVLFEIESPAHLAHFGREVKRAGDVNGDGVEDFYVNADWRGEIRSGLDGTLVHSLDNAPATVGYLYFAKLSDLDGDGRDEFLTGAPNSFVVYRGDVINVFSGAEAPRARLHDGATGTVIREFVSAGTFPFGSVLTGLDDIDGDGLDDVGVSDVFMDQIAGLGGSGFFAISSADGSTLWTAPVHAMACGRLGDVDGDGVAEIALGWIGGVEVRSGRTGTLVWDVSPGADFFGTALDVTDWNGDGFPDLVVGAHQWIGCWSGYGGSSCYHEDGYIEVLDGRTGSSLLHADGFPEEDGLGAGVAALGDTNGDGSPDVAAVAIDASFQGGTVHVISGTPLALTTDVHELSLAIGGTQTFRLDLGPSHANEAAMLFGSASGYRPGVSVGGLHVPLNQDLYTLYLAPQVRPLLLDGNGAGARALTLPPGSHPSAVGTTLHHAYVAFDPVTGGLTAASWSVPTTLQQ